MRKEDCKRLLCFLTVDTTDKDPEGNETVWFQNEVTRNKVDSVPPKRWKLYRFVKQYHYNLNYDKRSVSV